MRASKPKLRRLSRAALLAAVVVAVGVGSLPQTGLCDTPAGKPKATKLRENSFYYGAFNRRDPFRSLVEGAFIKNDLMELIDLNGVELVGIVRGELERFGLLEDEKGFTYILRVGDKVRNGSIVAIGEQTMTARIITFGQASKYTLHMAQRQKGDKR